jgi:hypothetical protein
MFLVGALGAGFLAGRLVRSVDTKSIVEAAKEGADIEGNAGVQGGQPLGTTSQMPAMSTSASPGSFPQELSPAVRP